MRNTFDTLGGGLVRLGRRELASLAGASALWAVVIGASGALLAGVVTASTTRAVVASVLTAWFGAYVTGLQFNGRLARRPFALRLVTLVAGGVMLRLTFLLVAAAAGDSARFPADSVASFVFFLIVGSYLPTTTQVAWIVAALAYSLAVPGVVMWVVDRVHFARHGGRQGAAEDVSAGVEQAHPADGQTVD